MLQSWALGVTPEPVQDDTPATIQTPPRFDPSYGFVADALFKGELIKVVLDVCTAKSSSPTLYQGLTPEMAINASPTTKVVSGSEPDSLVVLYREGRVIGFGARIKSPLGEDLLLTAKHVWDLEPTHMAKRGKSVPLAKSRLIYFSNEEFLDFSFVELPSGYWTSLGVRNTRLKKAGPRTPVRVFGGSSSQALFSASGLATYGKTSFELKHTATTVPGWSGTPLYHKGNVVGLHLGGQIALGVNRACNAFCRFELGLRSVQIESPEMEEDGPAKELEHAEWVARMEQGVPYERYEIDDEVYMVGQKDFYRLAHFDEDRRQADPQYRSWADKVEDDTSSLGSVYEAIDIETGREETDVFHDAEELVETVAEPEQAVQRLGSDISPKAIDLRAESVHLIQRHVFKEPEMAVQRIEPPTEPPAFFEMAIKGQTCYVAHNPVAARAALDKARSDVPPRDVFVPTTTKVVMFGEVMAESSTLRQIDENTPIRKETSTEVPLNYQRADYLRVSPPLENLGNSATTPGNGEIESPERECLSVPLASRVAGLEKLVERLSHQMSRLQSTISQSSPALDGQKGDPKPNSVPCCIRQESSGVPNPPRASKKPAATSEPNTPKPSPEPVSGETSGSTLKSATKSRKSRSRKTSTGKQVPESPSQT